MKLKELSIADLKAISDFAYKSWENSTRACDTEGIQKWFEIDFECRSELLNRINKIFKP